MTTPPMADDPRPTAADVLKEPAGRRLDSWVAEYALGLRVEWEQHPFRDYPPEPFVGTKRLDRYSTDWAAAGPLLGRGFGVEACRTARDDKGWLAICRALVVAALEDRR